MLLPRLARAQEGVTFASGNYVRKTGTVPAQLAAVRLPGSILGVHAVPKGGGASLCGVSLTNEATDSIRTVLTESGRRSVPNP